GFFAVNEYRPGHRAVDPGNPRAVMRWIEAAEKLSHLGSRFGLEVQPKPPVGIIIRRLRPDHPANHPWRIPRQFDFIHAHRQPPPEVSLPHMCYSMSSISSRH